MVRKEEINIGVELIVDNEGKLDPLYLFPEEKAFRVIGSFENNPLIYPPMGNRLKCLTRVKSIARDISGKCVWVEYNGQKCGAYWFYLRTHTKLL